MRTYFLLALLFGSVIPIGCREPVGQVEPDSTKSPDAIVRAARGKELKKDGQQRSQETSADVRDEVARDPQIKELQEYGARRMKRLLAKTGDRPIILNWDLSQDNVLAQVGWPANEASDEYILNQDIQLSLRLPGSIAVNEKGTLLICQRAAPKSDRLKHITFHLPRATTNDVYATTKDYIQRLQLEKQFLVANALKELDAWYKVAESPSAGSFLAARHDNSPIIDLEIHNSFDRARPWFISLGFDVSHAPLPKEVVMSFRLIRDGDAAAVVRLLDGGLPPDSRDVLGDSLLHAAAEHGQVQLAKDLLGRGAVVDAKGFCQQTPLWQAVLHGHLDVADILLQKGADINSRSHNGGTILHYTSEYQYGPLPNHQAVRWLLEHGASVDTVDNRGDTPLHKAAWKGHKVVVEVLLDGKADVDARNKEGMTPLDGALNQRQDDIADLLGKSGARSATTKSSK